MPTPTRRTAVRALSALITTLAVVSLAFVTGAPVEAKARAACPVAPTVIAHRGGEERYVENSGNAFRNATRVGAGFWETDVRFTSDNVPVLMHDATVDRTSDGTGAIADLTWAQMQGMALDGGQRIPTLWDLMNDQSVDKAYAFVELKVTPTEAQWVQFAAALNSRAADGGPKPVITSFDTVVLGQAATRLPGYTRGLIQSVGDVDPATVTPYASILLKHHDSITSSRVVKWTTGGLKVYAWADPSADPSSEWARMATYGGLVSGYITSSPQAYLLWSSNRVC